MPKNLLPKIALIGAGSVVFARRLITDILSFPSLQGSTLVLMDIDPLRLEMITALANKLVAQEKLPTQVIATTDRRAALDGADYVIVSIQVGGVDLFQHDIYIPRQYGIDQTVGDTIGPGGVFRGLRTVPVLLDICKDMAELCPNALMINYSNPMVINCWAMSLATKIRHIGLCHSVQLTTASLASYLGAPVDELSIWVAGINHMAWFLRLDWNGQDAYPLLRLKLDDPDVYAKDKVRFEIMRYFDYFVTESSHHMSEYVPYFRRKEATIDRYIPYRWDYLRICQRGWQTQYGEIQKQLASSDPLPTGRSTEYCSYIINAIETDTAYRINGNVQNDGLITNLPPDCCVEVPSLVDGAGVHPCYVGDLPAQLAGLNRANVNVQELAVQAALSGDRNAVYQALQLDPLTASLVDLPDIRKMADELFEIEKDWLPQFA
jgi:alpha-galactosidase